MTEAVKNTFRKLHFHFMKCVVKFVRPLPLPKGNVVIIAPHPDDEVLGCGGLIEQLVEAKRPPFIVILTGGEASHSGCCNLADERIVQERAVLTDKSLASLGVPNENIIRMNLPDGRLSEVLTDSRMTQPIFDVIARIKPTDIFVPHWAEGWPDHLATNGLGSSFKGTDAHIWEYCVWAWYYSTYNLPWHNGRKFRMTNKLRGRKIKAVQHYIKPLAPCGKPWSGVLPSTLIQANTLHTELYFTYD